jgi:hypothetical protein
MRLTDAWTCSTTILLLVSGWQVRSTCVAWPHFESPGEQTRGMPSMLA